MGGEQASWATPESGQSDRPKDGWAANVSRGSPTKARMRLPGKIAIFLLVAAVFAWPGYMGIMAAVAPPAEGSPPVTASGAQPPSEPAASTPFPAETAPLASTATPNPTPTPRPRRLFPGGGPIETAQIEEWILHFTNQERKEAGLRPFKHDPAISDIARKHSEAMILHSFRHTLMGKDPTDRALEAGYDCRAYYGDGSYSYGLSENIAQHPRVQRWSGRGWGARTTFTWNPTAYYVDAQQAARNLVLGWMRSPGHRTNILDRDSRRIGVGVAVELSTKYGWTLETFYTTQNFSGCK